MKTLEQVKSLVKALNYLEYLKELEKENKELSKETIEAGFKLLKQQLKDAGELDKNLEFDVNDVIIGCLNYKLFVYEFRDLYLKYIFTDVIEFKTVVYQYKISNDINLYDIPNLKEFIEKRHLLPDDVKKVLKFDTVIESYRKVREIYQFRRGNYINHSWYDVENKKNIQEILNYEIFKMTYSIKVEKVENRFEFSVIENEQNILIENLL